MHAPNLRYFAFVSQFVDVVTTSALDDAFQQARKAKRLQVQARRIAAAATGVMTGDRAA